MDQGRLQLFFRSEKTLALEQVIFASSRLDREIIARRGDTKGSGSSFRWSPAVKALAVLLLRHAAGNPGDKTVRLSGEDGSPAASLDYAVAKQTAWLLDMFGIGADGTPLMRELIKRENPERKRPGPVLVCINDSMLPPQSISVELDDKELRDPAELHKLADGIEELLGKRTDKVGDDVGSNNLDPAINVSVSKLFAGFCCALLAAFFWGTGNVVTRWTAHRLPASSFDISLVKYIAASTFCFIVGYLIWNARGRQAKLLSDFPQVFSPVFLIAAFAKGLNTYIWIVAVTLIPAGAVAVLENMHVVWTALAVSFILKERIPGPWIASSITIFVAATLIVSVPAEEIGALSIPGILIAAISGLAFSTFVLTWGRIPHSKYLWGRSIEMAVVLAVGILLMFPLHLLLNAMYFQGPVIPFADFPAVDFLIQAANGLLGIGVTYLLVNEAIKLTAGAGNLSALVIGIAMSTAVPITLIGEWLILGRQVTLNQYLGMVLFVVGFSTVRSGLLREE